MACEVGASGGGPAEVLTALSTFKSFWAFGVCCDEPPVLMSVALAIPKAKRLIFDRPSPPLVATVLVAVAAAAGNASSSRARFGVVSIADSAEGSGEGHAGFVAAGAV